MDIGKINKKYDVNITRGRTRVVKVSVKVKVEFEIEVEAEVKVEVEFTLCCKSIRSSAFL